MSKNDEPLRKSVDHYLRTYQYQKETFQLRVGKYGTGNGAIYRVVRNADNLQILLHALLRGRLDRDKAALILADIIDYNPRSTKYYYPVNSRRVVKVSDWIEVVMRTHGIELITSASAEPIEIKD